MEPNQIQNVEEFVAITTSGGFIFLAICLVLLMLFFGSKKTVDDAIDKYEKDNQHKERYVAYGDSDLDPPKSTSIAVTMILTVVLTVAIITVLSSLGIQK